MATVWERIRQMQRQGLDMSQIVARLTGTRDNSGGARQLPIRQLHAIGFSPEYIARIKGVPLSTVNARISANNSGGGPPATNPTPSGPNHGPGPVDQEWSKYDQAAADSLGALFEQYGLGSLAPKVADMMKRGMSEAAIVAELRETREYKDRFPGMEALRKQGYNAITESQYLQLEDSYHSALRNAGLPPGFYDSPQDFVKFMSNGVDPSEVKQRASAAVELVQQVDPSQRELLSSMYGVGEGDLAAYFLDSTKAMPLLQKQLATVGIANAAKKAGLGQEFVNRQRFEALVENGVSVEAAAQGYAQIAEEFDPLTNLSKIWGNSDWGMGDAESATFHGNADARKKRKGLIDRERAAFSGRSGFDSRVSGRGSSAGAF